jgi:hypothetical protein
VAPFDGAPLRGDNEDEEATEEEEEKEEEEGEEPPLDAPPRQLVMRKPIALELASEEWRVATLYKTIPTRSAEKMIDYDDIAPYLETGDLALFCRSGCSSGVIRWCTFSEWSHVGMVVRVREQNCDRLYLLESIHHDDGLVDHYSHSRGKTGVRLVDLYDALESNPHSYMGVVRLAWPSKNFHERAVANLWEFIHSDHSKGYESSPMVFVRLAVDMRILGRNEVDTREYFCSELVAEALKRMGALGSDFNSSDCTPSSFFVWKMPFVNGVQVHSLQFVSVSRT